MGDITVETVYPHPPERVWRALTDPDELEAWLMENDFEPRVGHRFQFRDEPKPGWRGIVDCEVLEVDEPRRLSFTWRGDEEGEPTVVTFILTPTDGGTCLRLEHTGFRGVGGFFTRLILSRGWKKKLLREKLPAVLETMTAKR